MCEQTDCKGTVTNIRDAHTHSNTNGIYEKQARVTREPERARLQIRSRAPPSIHVLLLLSPVRLEAQDVLQRPLAGLPQHAPPVVHVGGALAVLIRGVEPAAGVGLQAGLQVQNRLGDVVRVLLCSPSFFKHRG